jgi:hypothetical protein
MAELLLPEPEECVVAIVSVVPYPSRAVLTHASQYGRLCFKMEGVEFRTG